MGASDTEETLLVFGDFVLSPQSRRLLAGSTPVSLGSRAFDTLLILVEAEGRVVSKVELLKRVWPGTTVVEANISVQISAIRKVLGNGRRLVQTDAGRGYRFAGAVQRIISSNSTEISGTDDTKLKSTPSSDGDAISFPQPSAVTARMSASLYSLAPAAASAAAPPIPPHQSIDNRIEIILGRGRRIVVGADVDATALRRVLDALERR